VGDDRIKEAHAQCLLQEFKNTTFKDGKLVDDFMLCINVMARIYEGSGKPSMTLML
jgi:hypothetical protein